MFSYGYLQMITKPCRVSRLSVTLIDHIYMNDITPTGHSGIIITGLTDHFGTFYIICGKIIMCRIPVIIFSEGNIKGFKPVSVQIKFVSIMFPN